MDREQVRAVHETAKQVHHALAGILTSLELVIDDFDTLSPELKARFEDSWHKTYLQAIQDLSDSLPCFSPAEQADPSPAADPLVHQDQ